MKFNLKFLRISEIIAQSRMQTLSIVNNKLSKFSFPALQQLQNAESESTLQEESFINQMYESSFYTQRKGDIRIPPKEKKLKKFSSKYDPKRKAKNIRRSDRIRANFDLYNLNLLDNQPVQGIAENKLQNLNLVSYSLSRAQEKNDSNRQPMRRIDDTKNNPSKSKDDSPIKPPKGRSPAHKDENVNNPQRNQSSDLDIHSNPNKKRS